MPPCASGPKSASTISAVADNTPWRPGRYVFVITATLKACFTGTPRSSVWPAAMRAVVPDAVGFVPVKIRDEKERSGANRRCSYTFHRPSYVVGLSSPIE
jgi:hypothetical protein